MSDMTNKQDELLPCPFCGDEHFAMMDMTYMHADGPVKGKRVKCLTCGCQAPDTVWNTRPTPSDECEVNSLSSACCSKVTRACTKQHDNADEVKRLEEDARRYKAKRKAAYLLHTRMSVSLPVTSEEQFNQSYDEHADKNVQGYVIDHTGQFVKEPRMQIAALSHKEEAE